MVKIKWVFIASLIIMLVALPIFGACAPTEEVPPPPPEEEEAPPPPPAEPKILYIGGTFALTGAYAEDMAAVLAGFEDYAKYVNETKLLAPWRTEKFPADITLELLYRDDELKVDKVLTIYEELKPKMLLYRTSGSPHNYALMDLLNEDRMGATTPAVGPYLLSPPRTIFIHYPLYTDVGAAAADWFLEGWTETRAPRVAYFTADNAMGRSIVIPEMTTYLEELGFEVVGEQYVPLVPIAPPTTQLMWLKENNVDLTIGVMINPGSQPTIKEAVNLGMGPHLDYKITFAFASPSHLAVMCPALGELSDGVVVGGSYPYWDDPCDGIKFCTELQNTYHPDKWVEHIMYPHGVVEAMIQVEALRLAMQEVPFEELKPVDVLEYGFYRIKNLETGGITSTPLTFGPGDIEGMDAVILHQAWGGTYTELGVWPCRHIYKHE